MAGLLKTAAEVESKLKRVSDALDVFSEPKTIMDEAVPTVPRRRTHDFGRHLMRDPETPLG